MKVVGTHLMFCPDMTEMRKIVDWDVKPQPKQNSFDAPHGVFHKHSLEALL